MVIKFKMRTSKILTDARQWYWYWYRLPGLSPTPLNATLCHRGDPLSSGHVFLLLFLSNSSSPYPLEGMLAERPFSISLDDKVS